MVKSKNFKPIKNKSGELVLSSHSYTQPGIQSIKIVILRFPKNLSIVTETILVTKNIVINDGNLSSQDVNINYIGVTDFATHIVAPTTAQGLASVSTIASSAVVSNNTT